MKCWQINKPHTRQRHDGRWNNEQQQLNEQEATITLYMTVGVSDEANVPAGVPHLFVAQIN
mgnify:CR=1 FL=1